MKQTITEHIKSLLLGRKYYANICYMRGTASVFINDRIFDREEKAAAHAFQLEANSSYGFVQTISFRSRNNYMTHENMTVIADENDKPKRRL